MFNIQKNLEETAKSLPTEWKDRFKDLCRELSYSGKEKIIETQKELSLIIEKCVNYEQNFNTQENELKALKVLTQQYEAKIKSFNEEIKVKTSRETDLHKELDKLRKVVQASSEKEKLLEEQYNIRLEETKRNHNQAVKELAKHVESVGYEQTRNGENRKPDKEFYAGIIDIPNMKSLLNGWAIDINDWAHYLDCCKNPGTIVSVIGNYSRGKTFLLELLTGNRLPHGFNVNTQGISILYLKDESGHQRPIIGLDTKGGGLPLDIYSNIDKVKLEGDFLAEKLRDHSATEDLLQNFILEQASIVIVVVADLTFDDQKLVNKITRKFKGDSSKKIIVVHNLYHTHYVEDAKYKVRTSILPSFNLEPVTFKKCKESENNSYFVDSSRGKIVPHVLLAKKGTEAGDFFNVSTINYILNNIYADNTSKPVDIVQAFHEYLQRNLGDYIQAEPELKPELIKMVQTDESKPAGFRLENIRSIHMKEVFSDVFGDVQIFKEGFRPKYSLCVEHRSGEEKWLCLRIECPDDWDDVDAWIDQTKDEYWIHVKGQKKDSSKKRQNIDTNRQFGEFFIETEKIKKANFPVVYDETPAMNYENGMLTIMWKIVMVKRREVIKREIVNKRDEETV